MANRFDSMSPPGWRSGGKAIFPLLDYGACNKCLVIVGNLRFRECKAHFAAQLTVNPEYFWNKVLAQSFSFPGRNCIQITNSYPVDVAQATDGSVD